MNTRRRITLLTGLVVLVVLLDGSALAKNSDDLYVDAAATYNGDGSQERPYWRITDAVVAARELRQEQRDHPKKIVIHVLPGTYMGSYNPANLASNPRLELLPIILNISNLSLKGGTHFDEDSDGLPTGAYSPENETLLTTDRPLTRGQVLLLLARTTDGMAGNEVSVSGFVMDAQALLGSLGGIDIYVDRVSKFSIRRNLLRHALVGAQARLASGMFEANFVGPSRAADATGIAATGGSVVHPARVTIRHNRATQNVFGAALHALANFVKLDLGANTLNLEPLQMTYDSQNPEDQRNIPGTLEAVIESNDFSDNSFVGLRCGLFPPFYYTTADATQPVAGSLSVTVHGNRISRNFEYGIIVDPSNPRRSDTRRLTGTFGGTFEDNMLIENGRNASVFAFTNVWASIGTLRRQDYKYVQESTFQVADLDGELEGSDFDHPLTDPFDGSPVVGNTLIYNGDVQPIGIRITPRLWRLSRQYLSADGQRLSFTSNRPDGFGGNDYPTLCWR